MQQQSRDGVQLGPDVIREAGLVEKLEGQGNIVTAPKKMYYVFDIILLPYTHD